jgi:hypothetical protein
VKSNSGSYNANLIAHVSSRNKSPNADHIKHLQADQEFVGVVGYFGVRSSKSLGCERPHLQIAFRGLLARRNILKHTLRHLGSQKAIDWVNIPSFAGERLLEPTPQGTIADRHTLECWFSKQSSQNRS